MPLVLHSKSTLSLDGYRERVDCLTFSRDGETLFVARYPTVFVVRAHHEGVWVHRVVWD